MMEMYKEINKYLVFIWEIRRVKMKRVMLMKLMK